MYNRQSRMRGPIGFGGGSGGPPPLDVAVILVALFVTYSLRFFAASAALPQLLELSSLVWARGFVWQLVSYPFVGWGSGGLWFLVELLILFWFSRDVYRYLGPKAFRLLLAWSLITAGVVAVAVDLIGATAGVASPFAFDLMQGQRVLMAVTIAAFACAYRDATIMLFFVLPIQARWFIAIEILFAFMGFLATKDFAGFIGIVTAVGMTWAMLSGGLLTNLRRLRLHGQRAWYRARLGSARRKHGMHVLDGGKRGPRSTKGGPGDGRSGDGKPGNGKPRRGPWVN